MISSIIVLHFIPFKAKPYIKFVTIYISNHFTEYEMFFVCFYKKLVQKNMGTPECLEENNTPYSI